MGIHQARKKRYDCLGERVVEACRARHFEAYYCSDSEDVWPLLTSLISPTDVVSWGGSETLVSLGMIEKIKEKYEVIDRDSAKTVEERVSLMRHALLADTYLTGSNAVSEDGCLVNIDGNGNRVAALMYGPKNVIAIIGMNKVVHDVEDAIVRAKTIAAPCVAQRFLHLNTPCKITGSCAQCKSQDSICSHIVITRMCRPAGRIKLIFVGEDLGL